MLNILDLRKYLIKKGKKAFQQIELIEIKLLEMIYVLL